MMKNAKGKKMISGMVANVLEDITDVFLTGSNAKRDGVRWRSRIISESIMRRKKCVIKTNDRQISLRKEVEYWLQGYRLEFVE